MPCLVVCPFEDAQETALYCNADSLGTNLFQTSGQSDAAESHVVALTLQELERARDKCFLR
jgi:hypothetical protein